MKILMVNKGFNLFENNLRYTNHNSKNALIILEKTYDMFKDFI